MESVYGKDAESVPRPSKPHVARECRVCKTFKEDGDFDMDPRNSTWVSNECSNCRRVRNVTYRNSHSEELRSHDKERRMQTRLEVLEHYSGSPPKCACCGEHRSLLLTIDHVGGWGAEHRRAEGNRARGNGLYQNLRKSNYPEGFQVLCYNCNCAEGIWGRCPHKDES